MKLSIIGFGLAGLLVSAPAALAADSLTLTAEAGLQRFCKPGRWTPIRVTIDNRTNDVEGDLIVEWGHARVRRKVALPAPSKQQFELYVRTGDARAVMIVRLQANGRDLQKTEVPVQVVGTDQTLTLCAGSPGTETTSRAECSATMAADALPRSWRGYDAADRVVLDAETVVPTADQRRALELWRAVKRADDEGRIAPTGGVVPPASAPAAHVRGPLFLYISMIGIAGFIWRRPRSRASALYPALLVIGMAGSSAALALGRSSAIVVHHASVAEQFTGAQGALIRMRAVVEYPADDDFSVTPSLTDGVIDVQPARDEMAEQRVDAEGRPLLQGASGLAGTNAFSLEAASGFRAFDVARTGAATRVTNASSSELTGCEFPQEFAVPTGATLAPGRWIETLRPLAGADPVVACRLSGSPIGFVESHHQVVTDGVTTVLYHLPPAAKEP